MQTLEAKKTYTFKTKSGERHVGYFIAQHDSWTNTGRSTTSVWIQDKDWNDHIIQDVDLKSFKERVHEVHRPAKPFFLTEREEGVYQGLMQGQSNQEIAKEIGTNQIQVSVYIGKIKDKLRDWVQYIEQDLNHPIAIRVGNMTAPNIKKDRVWFSSIRTHVENNQP